MSSRLDQDFSGAFLGQLIMRNGSMHDRYLYQVLLRIFDTLGNGFLDFLGLTQTMADHTILVTDYHQSREAECTATLGCLYHAIDRNHLFLQFQIAGFNSV